MLADPPLNYSSVFDPANFVVEGSAVVAGTVTITNNDNNATFYPVFTSAAGEVETLNIDSANGPFAINPGTAAMSFGSTLRLAGVGGTRTVCFGESAGAVTTGLNNTYVGAFAGSTSTTANNNTAVGNNCGLNQAGGCVAVGVNAGNTSQGVGAVAIGAQAGFITQGEGAIAIGQTAGENNQGNGAVAIGNVAGRNSQGANSIAIGGGAGQNLGENAIAIGGFSGRTSQHANSICINGTNLAVDPPVAGCFLRPIRGFAQGLGVNRVFYDPATFELRYSTT